MYNSVQKISTVLNFWQLWNRLHKEDLEHIPDPQTSCRPSLVWYLFNFIHSNRNITMFAICIALMIHGVECLFICLFGSPMSSLVKCLVNYFYHFLKIEFFSYYWALRIFYRLNTISITYIYVIDYKLLETK